MVKENVAYTYSVLLFKFEKETDLVTWYNMNKSWKHYVVIRNSHKGTESIVFPLCEQLNVVNLILKSGMLVDRGLE